MWSSFMLLVSALFLLTRAEAPTNPRIYSDRKAWGWCGWAQGLPGMDDSECRKKFPPLFDREFRCPIVFDEKGQGFGDPVASVGEAMKRMDETELKDLDLPPTARFAAIVVRRSSSGGDDGGNYWVRYIGLNASSPYEPWSSSKVFAAANAAGRLQEVSQGEIGLQAFETGKGRQLADLMSIVTSYDHTMNMTSNSLGAYFHSIGGHREANEYIHRVLGSPDIESFGGNYGEAPPPSLNYNFTVDNRTFLHLPIWPDPTPSPPLSNYMSAVTMATWLKSIVLAREDRLNGNVRWEDARDVLYGAEKSSMFPDLQWGGMSISSDVYMQEALNISLIDSLSRGRWRIFSKFGFGFTTVRQRYETTLNSYLCAPVLDDMESPVPNRGLEVFVSGTVADKTKDRAADAKMQDAMRRIMHHLQANYGGMEV